ncbi:MAG TPA: DUF3016 domain-containing protein [Caldimonas sp.]
MRFDRSALISLCVLTAAALPAHAAGSVEIAFIAPAGYTDSGKDPVDSKTNEDRLARYLQSLGERYLGPDQVLKIDVLDVDLAGSMRPSRRGFDDIRIARGGADWPHIKMRYSLVEGGKVIQNGEETVADMNYLRHAADTRDSDPLRYEKRMLADWFKARFVEHKPAG